MVLGFAGGWAQDFGPSFTGAPQANALSLPFLSTADNVYFELDGAPHKIGGATRLNSAAVEETTPAIFHGIYDAWYQGTTGTETQKRVAYAGTKILKEDVDGTWDTLATGLENSKQPCFEMFGDLVIMATNSTVDVPQKWNGSAASTSNLGGSPPKFAFHAKHKNRMWAAGVPSRPSRLYYSAALDGEDWTGGTAGAIDIDPDDGDRIVGLISHKNELLVFKGPNRLSIHRITGSSPSDFARVPFVTGVGGINQNTIFRVNDDVVFGSPRGLHSLAATAAYGDYVEAFLSRPILTYYQDSLNHNVLDTAWGVNYQARGLALWTFAKSGGSTKNIYLVYDYRFQPGRWSSWGMNSPYVDASCLAVLQTTARKHRLFAGGYDGFAWELDRADRVIHTATAYGSLVESPFLNMGTSAIKKTAAGTFHSFQPKGDYNYTFGYIRDTNAEQTVTVSQGGTVGLG